MAVVVWHLLVILLRTYYIHNPLESFCLSVCGQLSVISQFSMKAISIRSLSHVVVLVGPRAVRRYSSHCDVGALCCAVGFKKQIFQNRRDA